MDFDVEEQVASPVASSKECGGGTSHSADAVAIKDEESIDLYSEFMLDGASRQEPAAFFETRPSSSSATGGNASGEIIGTSTVRPLDEDSNLDLYTETLREELQERHDSHMEVLERCEVAEARILIVEKELKTLRDETEKLEKEKTVIQNNMSSLLLTARTELKRKDNEIQRLRFMLSKRSSDASDYMERPRSNESSPSRNKIGKIWTECMKSSARQSRRTPPMLKVDEDSPRAKRKRSEDVTDSSPKRSRVRDSRSSPSDKKSTHRSTPERKSTPLKSQGSADKHGKSDSHRKGIDGVKSSHESGKSNEHRSRSQSRSRHTSGKSDSEKKDCDKNYGILDLREILRRKKLSKGCPISERDSEGKPNRSSPGDKDHRKGGENHRSHHSKKRQHPQERKDSLKKSVSVSPNKLPSAGRGSESGIQTNLNNTQSDSDLVKQTKPSSSHEKGPDAGGKDVASDQNNISDPTMNKNPSVGPAISEEPNSELSCIGVRLSSSTASHHLKTTKSSKPCTDTSLAAEPSAERLSGNEECLYTAKGEDSVLDKFRPTDSVESADRSAVKQTSDAPDSVTHITSSVRETSSPVDSIKCVARSAVKDFSGSVKCATSGVGDVSGSDSVKSVPSNASVEICIHTNSVKCATSASRDISRPNDFIKNVTNSAVGKVTGPTDSVEQEMSVVTESMNRVASSAGKESCVPMDSSKRVASSAVKEICVPMDSSKRVTSSAVKEICIPMDSSKRVTSSAVKKSCVPMDSNKHVASSAVKEIRRIKPTMICGRQNLTLSEEKTCDVLDPVIQNIVTRENTSFANAKVVHIDTSPDDDSGDSNVGSDAKTSRKDCISTEPKAAESTLVTASVPATDGLSLCVKVASSTCGHDHISSGFSQVVPDVKQHPDTSLTCHQGIPIKDNYPEDGPGHSSLHDSARKPSMFDSGSMSMPANDGSSEHSQITTDLRHLNTSRVCHLGVPIKNEDCTSDSSSHDSARKQSVLDNDAKLMHPNASDDNSFDNDPKSMLPNAPNRPWDNDSKSMSTRKQSVFDNNAKMMHPNASDDNSFDNDPKSMLANASSNRPWDNDSKSMSAHASSYDRSLDNRNVHFCVEENEHLLVCTVNLHPDHSSMSMMSDTMMSEIKSESFSSEISEADCPSELILKDEVCSRTIPYLYKSKKRPMHLCSPLKSSSIGGEVITISPKKKKAKKRRKHGGAGCFSTDEEQVSVTFDSDVQDADEEQNDFIPPRSSILTMPIQEHVQLSKANSLSETPGRSANGSEILNDVGAYAFSRKEEQPERVHAEEAEEQVNDADCVDGGASSSSSEVPRNLTADSSSSCEPSRSHTVHVIDARLKGLDRPYNLQTFDFTSFPTHYANIPTEEVEPGGRHDHSECSGSDMDDKQLNTSMEMPVHDHIVNKLDVSEIKEPEVERRDLHCSDVEMEDVSDRENVLVIADLDTESDTNSEHITDQQLPFSGMTERINPMDNVSNQAKPVDMCPISVSGLNISLPVRKPEVITECHGKATHKTETHKTETYKTETHKSETHKSETHKTETTNTNTSETETHEKAIHRTAIQDLLTHKNEAHNTASTHKKEAHNTATTHKKEAHTTVTIPKTKAHQTAAHKRSSRDLPENIPENVSSVVSVVGHVSSHVACALEEPAKPNSDMPGNKDRLLTLIKCKQRRTIGRQESLPAQELLTIEELSSSPFRKRSRSEPQRDSYPNVVFNLSQSKQCDRQVVADPYLPVDLSLKAGSIGQTRTVSPVLQTAPYLSGFIVSQDGALDLSRKANPSPSLQHGEGGPKDVQGNLSSRSTKVEINQTSDCVMKESKGLRRDIAKPSSSSFDNADSPVPLLHKPLVGVPVFLNSSTDKETVVINSKTAVNRFKVEVGELKDMNSSSSFGFSPITTVVDCDGVNAGQLCKDNEVVPEEEEPVDVSISSMDKSNCSLDERSVSASSHEMEFESIPMNPVSSSKAALGAAHSRADTSDGVSNALTSKPAEPSPMLSSDIDPRPVSSCVTELTNVLSGATDPRSVLSRAEEPRSVLSKAEEPSPVLHSATEPSPVLHSSAEPSPVLSTTIDTSGHTVNSCESSSNESESSESESDDFSIDLCVTDSDCMDMDLHVQSSSKSIPGLLPEGNFEALRNDLNMSDDSKPETSDSNLLQTESGSNINSKTFKLPDMSTSAFAKLTSASQTTGVSEHKSPEMSVKVLSLAFDEHSSLSLHADGCDFDHDFEDKSNHMGHGASNTKRLTVPTVTESVKDRKLCQKPAQDASKKMDDSIEDGEVTSDDADDPDDESQDLSELLKAKRLIEEKINGIKEGNEPLSSKNGRNGHRSERRRPERRHDHGAERHAKDHRPRDDHRTKSSSSDRERFSREIHDVDPRLGNRSTSTSTRHRYEKDEPRHGSHHGASTRRIPLDDRRDRHRASPTASVRGSHWDHSKENHRHSTDPDRSDKYSAGTRHRDGPGPERVRRRRDSHSRDSGRRSGRDLRS